MRHPRRLSVAAPVIIALAATTAAAGLGPSVMAQDEAAFDEAGALLANELNTIDIIERYGPSVVAVEVGLPGERTSPFASSFDEDAAILRGSGSGFLIEYDDAPYIVTNYHVVVAALEPDSATSRDGAVISVAFPAFADPVVVDVVGVNPSFDLALLRPLDAKELPPVPPLAIADSDRLEVGQKTIAIGNPFGLASTVTSGIVSATGRYVPTIGQVPVPMVQTDAAINPGNSGGPLLDSQGRLIGINTALVNPAGRSFSGLGFAVPSNLLVESLAELEVGGVTDISAIRPRLGIAARGLDLVPTAVRERYGLPDAGVAIIEVQPGSVADKAGLRGGEGTITLDELEFPAPGDVIVAIDGETVDSVEDITRKVTYESEGGDELALGIIRDGRRIDVDVVLEVSPDNGFAPPR